MPAPNEYYALSLLFLTPLALVITQLAHPSEPGPLLLDRGLETLIGALAGIAVVLATHEPATLVPSADET
ncbi:FUSC family protein [Arthrobacter sp. NPDC080031]|uniref:FUSC family protein n=1 Tax=Arthrobacter sp. NPDC080031 TaxID=3155918 RepID=UPI00344F49BF